MFQLDDQFLKDLGVDQLPEEEKQAFLDHVYSQLEIRVGTKLSEGLTEAQLAEFESFMNHDLPAVHAWLNAHAANYENDEAYIRLKNSVPQNTPAEALLAEYASLKWLEINRPNYRDIVSGVMEEIKREIIANRDLILAA